MPEKRRDNVVYISPEQVLGSLMLSGVEVIMGLKQKTMKIMKFTEL